MRLTSERLPWLTDEPVPELPPVAPARPTRVRAGKAMWPWYLLLLALIALVAGGGWWLNTRQREAAPPQLPAEEPIAIPMNPATPVQEVPAAPAEGPVGPAIATAAPPAAPTSTAPLPQTSAEPAFQAEAEAEGSADAAIGRSVFPADEPVTSAPPSVGPSPVAAYPAAPSNRGRVVQLGAFPNRQQAEDTWRKVTRRYPYLSSKPKMVNTVDVRSLGGRRRTRMYRLQLGTSSQAQSVVICQQLERAGLSCVVVY